MKAFKRGVLGFPLGIAMGYVITIAISFVLGKGEFFPCVPSLAETMGGELNAVVLQTVLCGLLGAGFGASSVIWEMENWSIAKQSGLYFFITASFMLPIAYFSNWMEHSFLGFLYYFGIYTAAVYSCLADSISIVEAQGKKNQFNN